MTGKLKIVGERFGSSYLLLISGALIVLGCIVLIFWTWPFYLLVNSILSLQTQVIFNSWKRNPVPLTLEIYVFNWKNPEDIYKANTKPILEEIGPFVFTETREKVNITWNNNNTVTFSHLRHWYFDRSRSMGNLSTKIVTVNAIVVTAGYILRNWNFIVKLGFSFVLKSLSMKIYKETTVGEILFDGYSDDLIHLTKLVRRINMPNIDKFGYLYSRNGSSTFDGTFNVIYSGDKIGNVEAWNYAESTSSYCDACNKVHGSTGEFYSRDVQKTKIGVFMSDICRYVPMDYEQELTIDGTNGYKFILGPTFLDNGTNYPQNKCFSVGENIPSGVLNVSSCKYGAPTFISQPHFYGADPYYHNMVDGLNPRKERHEMFVTIEPKTAIPLHVEARLQLNILIQPIKHISILQNAPKIFMPILWSEQKAAIPGTYNFILKVLLAIPIILQCAGCIMILTSISLSIYVLHRQFLVKYKNQITFVPDR